MFSAVALIFLTKPVEIIEKLSTGDVYINISYVIGTSIVVTILPYIFYTLGLTKIENSHAAVIACIEPIMATVLGFVIYHEVLSISEITGVVLVLIAIILLG